jgi:cation-transporting P-type ATPase E
MAQNVLTPPAPPVAVSAPGLSAREVQERVQRGATNNYQARVNRSYRQIILENVFNLFNIILFSMLVIVISFQDYTTAVFAGFSVVTNSLLGTIQEMSAKRKLDRLATLSEQKVRVRRENKDQDISMRDIVVDDVVMIEPGSKVVVDGVVLHSDALEMDESLLTGESDAVFKQAGDEVFSGSFCIAGAGTMRATRVGKDSNINKLSAIARTYKNIRTPTQTRIDISVEVTVLLMFVFIPALFITAYLTNVGMLDAFRNAVVFMTSLVPQGLVLVAILSLTIGAIKISRHDTLIQKVNAVESLANCTVLCFDKTGTLTKNQLAVTEIIPVDGRDVSSVQNDLSLYVNSLAYLNRTAGAVKEFIDKTDAKASPGQKVKEIGFTSGRKWGALMLQDRTLVLGAPERILPPAKDEFDEKALAVRASKLSQEGMRVLAFAEMQGEPSGNEVTKQAQPLGIIVLSDSVRDDIQETLSALYGENLKLKVISGDGVETVQAIAKQSGMQVTRAYAGTELEAMSDAELEIAAKEGNVFARIEPETKRRLVTALQNQREYVAMTGDGVNDVPALKQANLAIVMNDGTQISKDVADIVLLNNAMSTLPMAFKEGKEITQTIYATMKMFLVKNVYTVFLFILALFMAMPFPMTPAQISWATFGAVNIPATFVAFGWMRPAKMTRFRRDVLDYIFTVGFIGAVLHMLLYTIVYFGTGQNIDLTRSVLTVYLTLFSAYMVCTIQGVDFYEPKTFVTHWRTVALMLVMVVLTLLSLYIAPSLFDYVHPSITEYWWIYVLLIALTVLGMQLISHGMKHRYLMNRFWDLFRPDER